MSLNIEKRRQARKQRHQKMLALVNSHRKKIGKEPFPDYQAFQEHEESDSPHMAGSQKPSDDEAGAYQIETAKILLDLRALARAKTVPSI